jgi:glutamine---fructose-6-phosphate transaminase (isomerizing)
MTTTTKDSARLLRCSKCIMPNSAPGSDFDESGTCKWCRTGFPKYSPAGDEALRELLVQNRAAGGYADCMVGVSGGKDSSYVLLQLKRKFDMRVEAFTYVHDGSSAFSVKNAKKMCDRLGVVQHIVSLPNHLHRKTCKGFFQAWATSEDAVAAAMTCVGCKHLHLLGTRLARDRGIPMMVWSVCPLETPPFIPSQRERSDGAEQNQGMAALAMRLAKSMCTSWRFCASFLRHWPTCVAGCLAFQPGCRFLTLRYPSVKHVQFFDYCQWNGDAIVRTLQQEVGWEIPESVKSDWHSDCYFNVLKEYMFQKMYHVSYTDAFLSNQIRIGLISRERAYGDLLESKRYFAGELKHVLNILGLDRLYGQLASSCFDVENA